jgi:intein/homing endonuclease
VENIALPNQITLELAEETGWHIGDGSMNYYMNKGKLKGIYQLRGHLEDDRMHYEKRIKPFFDELYGVKLGLREMPSTRVFGFQFWSSKLVKFKEKLGLPLGKKLEVFIPEIFLKNDELKRAVIRGIFDTDGGIYLERKNNGLYPKVYISTISFKLANQIKKILEEFNFIPTLHSQHYRKNRQKLYVVSLRGIKMFNRFMLEISPKNPKHENKYELFLNSQNL